MTAELKPITGVRESVEDLSGTVTEYSYVTPTEEAMRELTRLLFEGHWREIIVGPCIEGAVFEIRFEQAPKKSLLPRRLPDGRSRALAFPPLRGRAQRRSLGRTGRQTARGEAGVL